MRVVASGPPSAFIGRALLASIALHALVLEVIAAMDRGGAVAPVIVPLRVAATAMPSEAEPSAGARDAPAAVSSGARPERSGPQAASRSASTVSPRASRDESRVVPVPALPADDIGDLPRYRMALAFTMHRLAGAPAAAPGPRVRLVLGVEVDASGALAGVVVRRSSGDAATDASAIDLVRRSYGSLPLPPTLRGASVVFDVTVDAPAPAGASAFPGENATT